MLELIKVCVALITYTLFLKATNHLARERAIKGSKEIEVVPKFLTPDGAWCWFADPRAVYYEGMISIKVMIPISNTFILVIFSSKTQK